jgi:hypothetical protein
MLFRTKIEKITEKMGNSKFSKTQPTTTFSNNLPSQNLYQTKKFLNLELLGHKGTIWGLCWLLREN